MVRPCCSSGAEIKGARRWIYLAGVSFQPSEYLKPSFVVICAWLFCRKVPPTPTSPGNLLALLLLAVVVVLLVAQPDLGQSLLVVATWGTMFFMAGMPWLWIMLLGGRCPGGRGHGLFGLPACYRAASTGSSPGEGDTYQVDMGREALVRGGWFGQGPGEGSVKRILPDSHTDFIFAVAGEEFGLVACMIILGLFAFIVLRGLGAALRERDDFTRYAVSGLVVLFGLQAIINMGVNVQLLPAKGHDASPSSPMAVPR